ncbi:hemicentin-1-like isoform X10 [Argopecten irradians]|uniref:hemicentin-1-like isoform X10 n=1 Tax=Argopecten irradians TaxID=31199 RepID=UPI00371E9149
MGIPSIPRVLPCLLALISMSPVVFSQTPPSVAVAQANVGTNPGTTVVLGCSVSSTLPITSAFWLHDRAGSAVTITSSGGRHTFTMGTAPSLTITSPTNADTGNYRCFATDSGGNVGQSGNTFLTVATPNAVPVVDHPQTTYSLLAGNTAVLGCVISANPAATTVVWTKTSGSNIGTISIDGTKYQNGNSVSPSLTITNLALTDTGSYTCGATNNFGSGVSTGATLTVTGSVPVLSVQSTTASANVGASATLQCSITSASPSVTAVYWQFTPTGGTTTQITPSTSGYTGITTANPSLTISSVSTASAGTYTCFAVNSAGTGQSQQITLTVVQSGPPTVSHPQPTYTTNVGGTVTLVCSVTSTSTLNNLYWEKLVNNAYQQVQITTNIRYSGGSTSSPNFVITNAEAADAGTYRCSAVNAFGTTNSQTTTTLTVNGPPTVSHPQPTYSTNVGGTVTLVCSVTSTPTLTNLYWEKFVNNAYQQVQITTNIRYSGGSPSFPNFVITNAEAADAGTYRCSAVNAFGTTNSQTTTTLTINGPPTVSHPQPTYSTNVGGTVTLACSVISASTLTNLYWEKLVNNAYQQVQITTNIRYSGGSESSPNFVITNAEAADAGTYRCSAVNAFGTTNSQTTTTLTINGPPTVSHPQPTYNTNVGGTVTLVCSVTSTPTLTNLYWEKLVNNAYQQVQITTNIRYSGGSASSPNFVITNAEAADAGTYRCSAVNAFGTTNSQTTTTLTINGPPTVSHPQPTYSTNVGGTVTLVCSVTSTPTLTNLYWEKFVNNAYQQVQITTNIRYSGGSPSSPNFVITNAEAADAGTYRCSAVNAFGTTNSQTTTTLTINAPPSVTHPQAAYSTNVGGTVTLLCSVTSMSTLTNLYWEKLINNVYQQVQITTNSRYSGGSASSPNFVITNAAAADAGTYRCSASNVFGTTNSPTTRLVSGTPPTVSHPQPTYSTNVGGTVTLVCTVTSSSTLTNLYWEKLVNNAYQQVQITTNIRYSGGSPSSPNFVITNAAAADAGTYRCSAANVFGTTNSPTTTTLTINAPPSVTHPQAAYSTNVGGTVTLVCTVTSSSTLTNLYWEKLVNNVYQQVQITTNSRYSGGSPSSPNFVITNAAAADAGTYRCSAANVFGTTNSPTTTTLTINAPPSVTHPQAAYSTNVGGTVTLVCTVTSSSTLTNLYWEKLVNNVYQQVQITTNSRYSGGTTTSPNFVITNAQTTDAGTYRCSAANQYGNTNSPTTTALTVTGNIPTVAIPQTAYSTTSGQSVTLVCTVNANPFQTGVTWQKFTNGVYQPVSITGNSRYSGGTVASPSLVISNALTTDGGTYRCTAVNSIGTGTSGNTLLTVAGTVPNVNIDQTIYTATSGDTIIIVCNINADPFQTNIAWEYLDNSVFQTVQINSIGRYTGGTTTIPSLTISGILTTDGGIYRCVATNNIGTTASGTTQLTVSGTIPTVSIPTPTYATNSGGTITMVCNVNADPTHTSVSWQKNTNGVFQAVNIVGTTRYSGGTANSPSLVITGAVTGDTGTYRCTATNSVGTGTSGNTQLTITGSAPSVTIPQPAYSTNSGGTITLTCQVTADPTHTSVTWRKLVNGNYQDVSINTNTRYSGGTVTSPSLMISGALTTDGGTYICTAANQFGTGTSGTTLLTVSPAIPTVSIPTPTYATNSGGTITMVCNVNADPTHTSVSWQKNTNGVFQAVNIVGTTRYSGGTANSPSLVITGAVTGDTGTYRCTATNSVGTGTSGNTQLTITGSAPSVTIPQPAYSTNSGGTITLTCQVTADPTHTSVTWRKLVNGNYQDVSINTNTRYSGGTVTSPSLMISGALTTDGGTYICTAANQFGTGTSGTTLLTVSPALPVVTVQQNTYTVAAAGTIQMVCTVTADPTHTNVIWQKLVNSVYQTVQVTSNTRYSGATVAQPSLTITSAQLTDAGTYRCTAVNTAGTGFSAQTVLTVTGSQPTVSIPQTAYTATTGTQVTLVCIITNDNPAHTSVIWQKLVNNAFQEVQITSNNRYTGGQVGSPNLVISSSQPGDGGTYRCTATNTVGTGTSGTTQLTVSGSVPTVSIPQPSYTATTSTTVTLVCTITADPTHTSVSWEKLNNNVYQEVPITSNTRYSGGTAGSENLVITNAESGDSGTYRCTATNSVGTGTSGTTQLTVSGSIPTVSIPQPSYTATTSTTVTLVCTVTANPTHTSVSWEKLNNNVYQEVPITSNTRYSGGTAGSENLVITNAEHGDSGTYRCTATNTVGTGTSGTTQLTVSGSIPTVSIPQPSYTATTSTTVTLVCTVTANPTHTSVSWEKLNNNVYQEVPITSNTRYSGGTAGSENLVITNAQPGDSGTYRCTATNIVGTGTSGTTQLAISGTPPTVTISQPTYTATTGTTVTIVCTITNANPTHTSVIWQKLVSNTYQQVQITTNSRYTGGTVSSPNLMITNAQPGDSGTYRCLATNIVGTGISTTTTQLTVSGSLPIVTIGQQTYTATTGTTVIVGCTVNANPFQTSVEWERLVSGVYQTVAISTNNRYSGGSPTVPSLTISNAQPSDTGTYRCKATNAVGTGNSQNTQLTVSGNVPVVDIPQPTYSVVTGASINIPCSVTSNPTHTAVTWQRQSGGQTITIDAPNSNNKYTIGALTAPTLTINNAVSGDAGLYTCTATNAVGPGQDSTTLSVTGNPPTVTIPQSGYSVQTGNSLTIPCTIAASPSITAVQWLRVQGTSSTPLTITGTTYSGGSVTTPALTIPTANRATHEGFYVCTATNAVGTGQSSTIFVSVTGNIPTVTVQTTPATAITGTSVTLQCTVTANPIATIVQWEKVPTNGAATMINVAGNSKYSGASTSDPSLTISNTAASDAGNYRCTATNAIGKGQSGLVALSVTGNPPTVTVTQTDYAVTTGAAVTLQCSATGVPAVTSVAWEKTSNGLTTTLTVSSGQFSVSNPSLVISTASSTDAGTYICKATNVVGTGQSNPVTLAVTGAPPTVTIGNTAYSAITGSSATLVCTVTATPTATIVRWTKTTSTGTSTITIDGTKYTGSSASSPSLVINNVANSDEGTYVCQATNVVGTASSAQTTLTVTGSVPNVQVVQTSYSVLKGGTITLGCTVTGLPTATSVVWKRMSGGTETAVSTTPDKYSGSTVGTPSLTITGAASVDAATYVCTATNSVGEGRSGQTSLSVTGDIPTVSVPDPTYSIVSGNSVTLRCTVSANPPVVSIQWRKIISGVTTNVNVGLTAYTGGTVGTPALTIVTATAADSAGYICTATNSVGTGVSGTTTLTVTGAVPTVNIPLNAYTVITGQSITIVCNVAANPTASSISWSKTVGTVTSILTIDNTKFTGGNIQTPSLTINNAGANDEATYKCSATNVVGSATSNAATLDVTGGLPTVTITNPPPITAVVGSSVTLTCTVVATPQASSVTWKRTVGGVTSNIATATAKFSGSTVANPSLTINSIATTDQGSYVCTATNAVGTGESSPATLAVTGNVPSVVISKPSYTVVVGQDVTIDCQYTASPDATSIKWRKIVNTQPSDITITGNAKYSGGTLTSPSLVIRTAANTDQAFYQCFVTNSVGEGQSSTAYLFVTGAPPTATVTQTNYNINLGDSVTIACNVAGVPAVTSVSWTITKAPSTTATPITIAAPKYSGGSVTTPSLTISSAALTDQGTYNCKATNSLGTGTSPPVYVSVVGSSPTVSVPVSAFSVDRGGQVVLLCNVIANPAATSVYWTRTVSGATNQITAAAPKYEGSSPTNPSLTINNLIDQDQGSYRCHATNSVGTGQSELTNLVVSVPPTNIAVNPATITRREQQSFTSTCTAEANPAPSYQWVKKSTNQVVSTVQQLSISNIDRGHHGEYVCTATNSRGSASATLTVNIQYKPISTVTVEEQNIVIGLNDPRTLTCNTIANPAVDTYRWTKGNANIAGATGLTYVVTVASDSDYGAYSCYATNSIGESTAITFNLRSGAVTTTTVAPTTDPLTTEVIIAIAVAAAVLLLILIIVLVCCLARKPQPKVRKVYTRKPTPAPMTMIAPQPMLMSNPSMALVPTRNPSMRSYDNYALNYGDLPNQDYTYYESERNKDRSSFIE